MREKPKRSLDDLITGVKQLLREDRCSFSDEDKVLLNECLDALHQAKENGDPDIILRVLEILSKVLIVADHLKDIF